MYRQRMWMQYSNTIRVSQEMRLNYRLSVRVRVRIRQAPVPRNVRVAIPFYKSHVTHDPYRHFFKKYLCLVQSTSSPPTENHSRPIDWEPVGQRIRLYYCYRGGVRVGQNILDYSYRVRIRLKDCRENIKSNVRLFIQDYLTQRMKSRVNWWC